ncbi:hypothetical protein BD410DRAFT_445798 [Rickenella mellea]|uniref:Uncharacterized protein n=1 Tax=Rickenella mellea TaxID=50990 RepID=A0A4Y7PXJ7_9AGAM|nr:hypothetical protein BD410DRAFT_445798 [Rickenella mellea]
MRQLANVENTVTTRIYPRLAKITNNHTTSDAETSVSSNTSANAARSARGIPCDQSWYQAATARDWSHNQKGYPATTATRVLQNLPPRNTSIETTSARFYHFLVIDIASRDGDGGQWRPGRRRRYRNVARLGYRREHPTTAHHVHIRTLDVLSASSQIRHRQKAALANHLILSTTHTSTAIQRITRSAWVTSRTVSSPWIRT